MLDKILTKTLPTTSDSSLRRFQKAVLSLQQEERVHLVAKELRNNVVYLTHHSVLATAQGEHGHAKMSTQEDEELKMLQWLSSLDPSVQHNRAAQQREPGTSQWLWNSHEFRRWESSSKGLAWLHGIR